MRILRSIGLMEKKMRAKPINTFNESSHRFKTKTYLFNAIRDKEIVPSQLNFL